MCRLFYRRADNEIEVIEVRKFALSVFILLALVPRTVFAATYYTDYSDWVEVDHPIEDSELEEGMEKTKYKFYQEETIYSDEYYALGQNPEMFPYRSDQKLIGEFGEWNKEEPEELEGRTIEKKTVYPYQELKKISEIELQVESAIQNQMEITELEVKYQDELIPITVHCDRCNEQSNSIVTDGNYNGQAIILNPGNHLTILFDQEYNPEYMEVKVYQNIRVGNEKNIYVIKDTLKEESRYIETRRFLQPSHDYDEVLVDTTRLASWVKEARWDDTIIESDAYPSTRKWINKLNSRTYYRYQDTKYLYYKIVRNYLEDYEFEKEGYIKDLEQSIPVYYQRTRDKIVLKDEMVLTKPYLDLDEFILSSTIPLGHLLIKNNIDWNTSGTYQITISYKDLVIYYPVQLELPQTSAALDLPTALEDIEVSSLEEPQVALVEEDLKKETPVTEVQEIKTAQEKTQDVVQQVITFKKVLLWLLLIFGIWLLIYSLEKIVDRKK